MRGGEVGKPNGGAPEGMGRKEGCLPQTHGYIYNCRNLRFARVTFSQAQSGPFTKSFHRKDF